MDDISRFFSIFERYFFNNMVKREGKISKYLPYIVAAVLYVVVAVWAFAPQLEGRRMVQHDVVQFDGMSRDIRECREQTGEDPQWTGAMFGGMPAYMINIRYPSQLLKGVAESVIQGDSLPIGMVTMAMFAAFLAALLLGVSPWAALVAGLAYGLSTYLFLIIDAGHITKVWAMVYAPPMLGAVAYALRRKALVGAALVALFGALEIGANHPQVTYYFLLAVLCLWISEAVFALRQGLLRDFVRRTMLLLAAGVVAVGANFSSLYYTAQHTADTTRGGSEVAAEGSASKGLDIQYATAWSYGIAESWTLFIPDFIGKSSTDSFAKDGTVAQSLDEVGLSEWATQLPLYWGDQPYTAGPTYLGAVAIFFALLGVLLADARNRWWVVAATVLMLLLAWGYHAMWFTEWAMEYLPFYNKFRTVSMALVVVEWLVPMMAAYGIWRVVSAQSDEASQRHLRRAVFVAGGVTAGVALLFTLFGSTIFDFGYVTDAEAMAEQFQYMLKQSGGEHLIERGLHFELGDAVAAAMSAERGEVLESSALRSLMFVLLAMAVVWSVLRWRRSAGVLAVAAAVLVAVDMLPVALDYVPHSRFVEVSRRRTKPTDADRRIMEDKELGYRVFNLSVSPFNDATTSMYHRSVGGYHGAKMGRYQDIIDRYLNRDADAVLDMLNTKYVISRQGEVIERPTALGAAWFVERLVVVGSAAAELEALGTITLADEAVVNEAATLPQLAFEREGATISLAEYRPNYLRYEYEAPAQAFAVFSEIYYDKGWTMYVDGEPSEAMRCDYVLRGAVLPAGKHTVEWRFKAPHWTMVEAVSLVSSLAIIVLIITILAIKIRRKYETAKNNEG